jgi:hypothetical protein
MARRPPVVLPADLLVPVLLLAESPLADSRDADPNLMASLTKCAADTISPDVLMADRVTFIWPMA